MNYRKFLIFVILILIGTAVSTFGTFSIPLGDKISDFWPGVVIQALGGMWFGYIGVMAGAIFPIISNYLVGGQSIQILGFIPVNIVQSLVPLLFYCVFKRKPCIRSLKDAAFFFCFVCVLSMIVAGIFGQGVFYMFGYRTFEISRFINDVLVWSFSHCRTLCLIGLPMMIFFSPVLFEGNLILTDYWKETKNIHIEQTSYSLFLKILAYFTIAGVLPLIIVGFYQISTMLNEKVIEPNYLAIVINVCLFSSLIFTAILTNHISRPFKSAIDKIFNLSNKYGLSLKKRWKANEMQNLTKLFDEMSLKMDSYQKRAKENAALASIGSTAATIAHDVRKPLSGLKALLTVLPDKKDDPAFVRKMVKDVEGTINKTNAMLSEILEFSHEATILELKNSNPQSIIAAALSDVFIGKNDVNMSISYNLKSRNYLKVDSNRLIRVLTNIIGNAVEAMDGKGKLWFKTEDLASPLRLKLTIGNDGSLIPDDVQKKIFDPFFSKGKKGGTGLGLAICQKIVDMHGGNIYVSSLVADNSNRTEFTIELPASKGDLDLNDEELIYHSNELKPFREEEAARVDYGDTANTSEFMRINKEKGRPSYLLIVDDEPLFRESIRCLLGELGPVKDHVKVVEADSAEKALTLFQSQEFDYVIADIDLGKKKMNGYEFSRMVLGQYHNAHVLIHSNKRKDEMDKNIRQIENPRFLGFLPKPMRASELLQFLACKSFEVKPASLSEIKKKTNVLLVNDDDSLRTALKWQIKSAGNAQVVEAGSVSDALSKIADNDVDIILSDINMGDGEPSGYDLLKKFRESGKGAAKFYMVSGYSKQSEGPKALSLGADGYCQLPLEEAYLKEILNGCQ